MSTLTVEPVLDQLLVQLHEDTETTESGIVLKSARNNPVGTVIAAGPGRYDSNGRHITMQAKKGDIVVLDRDAAFQRGRRGEVVIGGNAWFLVNESGVIAVLRRDPEPVPPEPEPTAEEMKPTNDPVPAPPPATVAPVIITPTVGRRVWYWPSAHERVYASVMVNADLVNGLTRMGVLDSAQPFDAGIVFVHNHRCVNLSVTDHEGRVHARTSVPLLQDGDSLPPTGAAYAQWMPYQVGQAKK